MMDANSLSVDGATPERARVLIVDDTPDSVWFLAEALKGQYLIQMARNGETALKLLDTSPLPDIVLLDVQMPGMDGYQVCRSMKEKPATRDIPVIFVTSTIDPEAESRGLRLGAVDYIHKPFSPDTVRARVSNTVDFKRHREQLHTLVHLKTQALRKSQEGTIMALADMAEWRDPETGGHIRRTQEYVALLARALAKSPLYVSTLTPQAIDMMYMCAPLHDVGKVSIPDSILLKAGRLSSAEFAIMQKHCEFGAQVLRRALDHVAPQKDLFLEMAHEVARWHHERWDGQGYPDGLSGEAIPLSARIMTVADVYDALISRRPYKEPYSHEKTVDIMIADSGQRFDPHVMDAFLQCQNDMYEISRKIEQDRDPDPIPALL